MNQRMMLKDAMQFWIDTSRQLRHSVLEPNGERPIFA